MRSPSSVPARNTRTAISPLLAHRILLKGVCRELCICIHHTAQDDCCDSGHTAYAEIYALCFSTYNKLMHTLLVRLHKVCRLFVGRCVRHLQAPVLL